MRQALGRGLESLIPPSPPDTTPSGAGKNIQRIPVASIRPNHLQPRRHFDQEKLNKLADSIKRHGLAAPIVVTHDAGANSYEIVAGERRLKAAQLAGLNEIDVIIRGDMHARDRLAIALVENLQREGLNPIEEALGYLRLMKEFTMTQVQVADAVGKSASAVSNTLRLLDLPTEIQEAIQSGSISEGHGRALLGIRITSELIRLFNISVEQQLSVRALEDHVRRINSGQKTSDGNKVFRKKPRVPADFMAVRDQLQKCLGTKVEIKLGKSGDGSIIIDFHNLDDFNRLLELINK